MLERPKYVLGKLFGKTGLIWWRFPKKEVVRVEKEELQRPMREASDWEMRQGMSDV